MFFANELVFKQLLAELALFYDLFFLEILLLKNLSDRFPTSSSHPCANVRTSIDWNFRVQTHALLFILVLKVILRLFKFLIRQLNLLRLDTCFVGWEVVFYKVFRQVRDSLDLVV